MPIRVLSIFGTRPEAVKMAPVIKAMEKKSGIVSYVCVTAQHREMLDQVLDVFEIKPNVDLDLMRPDQSQAGLSAAIFTHLDPVLENINPDWVLVQGDTTTVAIATLLSYYRHIKVGHVEAGLRTFDKWHPFPEEINRRVAGITADLHFAPTEWTKRNLLREGISETSIRVTGNPVIDALKFVSSQKEPEFVTGLSHKLALDNGKRLILVTAHRRESFGAPLENIFRALLILATRDDLEIIYPVHLNPNVQEPAWRMLQDIPHITLLPPLGYLPMVHIMKKAAIVLTDSGGIQEEAPSFGVPTLVLRDVTERPEGVEAGILKLVGTSTERITSETTLLLDDPAAYALMAKATNPFGDGHAAQRIVESLQEFPIK
ncbi:MAG: UDP-N-acetylglucosamine 2-epimerase (non-hydrolyzing) [Chloroflexota bacterium]